jgi:phospholipase D-like protein
MLRLLPVLLLIALSVYALIDCLSVDASDIRGLPRIAWVFVILLFPLIGPTAWLLAGRPARTAVPDQTARRGSAAPARRPLAPDDDPEFLRRLGHERRDDEDLLRRWEADLRRREEEMRKRDRRGEDKPNED